MMVTSIIARQALLSMEFSRLEHCSGSPCPSPGHLLDPGVEPGLKVEETQATTGLEQGPCLVAGRGPCWGSLRCGSNEV